jgi:hypothetical protein
MNPERLLFHADTVRAIVLAAEGKVLSGRVPPYHAYRNNHRGRRAWLDKGEVALAREPWAFGDD